MAKIQGSMIARYTFGGFIVHAFMMLKMHSEIKSVFKLIFFDNLIHI